MHTSLRMPAEVFIVDGFIQLIIAAPFDTS
jgi:hypothetical protein